VISFSEAKAELPNFPSCSPKDPGVYVDQQPGRIFLLDIKTDQKSQLYIISVESELERDGAILQTISPMYGFETGNTFTAATRHSPVTAPITGPGTISGVFSGVDSASILVSGSFGGGNSATTLSKTTCAAYLSDFASLSRQAASILAFAAAHPPPPLPPPPLPLPLPPLKPGTVESPGDYLLRAARAVVDSGRVDDPATVASLLHLSIAETRHSVWGECPAGGDRIDDNYAITGSNWFHPLPTGDQHMIIQVPFQMGDLPPPPNPPPSYGKQTETVLGDPNIGYSSVGTLRCHDLNQNQLYVSLTFNNIPAYACISEAQIKAVFPEAAPPAPFFDPFGRKPDFVFSNAGTSVRFEMTLYPGVADPHHQPVCLMDMSINGGFQYGPLHRFDVSFTPPVVSEAGVISPRTSQTPPTDPGTYLLHVVKVVTDGGRVDDPAVVANLLHASLTPIDYENDGVISCPTKPAMQGHVYLDYLITGNTWFHALPTGKRVLVKGFSTMSAVKLTNLPIGDPTLSYNIAGQVACTKSSSDGVSAQITFDNIPPYACISTAQIKSFFPSAYHPTGLPKWAIADLRYSNADSNVDFTMTTSTYPGAPAHQPVCLKAINIGASYPWGGLHKLDVGT